MSFLQEESQILKFSTTMKILKKVLKECYTTKQNKISESLQEEILAFPLIISEKEYPMELLKHKPPQKNPRKQILSKDYFTKTFSLFLDFLDYKELLNLRRLNQVFFSIIMDYLQTSRLQNDETALVKNIFSLGCYGYDLKELKEFCFSQIPNKAKPHIISLDYGYLQKKIEDFDKTQLKNLRDINKNEKNIDGVFQSFCKLFGKKAEFIRNKDGFSEENWFITFHKLIKNIILNPQIKDLSYCIDLVKEENIVQMVYDIEIFRFIKDYHVGLLIEIYKLLISIYFCENPFVIWLKKKEKGNLETLVEKLNKSLKKFNLIRKILKIPEKMKIILDFSGFDLKKQVKPIQNRSLSQNIIEIILQFFGNRELSSLRSLSKINKTTIENILKNRLDNSFEKISDNFKKLLCFIINQVRFFFPKNYKEYHEIKKNTKTFEIFINIFFPKGKALENFLNNYDPPLIIKIFGLKKSVLSKIKEFNNSTVLTPFELFIEGLKLFYQDSKSQISNNLNELLIIIESYNGLIFPKPQLTQQLLEFICEKEITSCETPQKTIIPYRNRSQETFLIITNKILPFLSLKDLYYWGLSSKQNRLQTVKPIETKMSFLQQKLKKKEIINRPLIKSLKLFRKLNEQTTKYTSEELIHLIDELSNLDSQEIKNLKSLNKFPKKLEIFLKPFLLLFERKGEKIKFQSFQTFLKRKDLIKMINSLNIETIPSETMRSLESYLYDFRDFFKEKNIFELKKKDIYEKFTQWLIALKNFFRKVRRYHISYEESLNFRFPERNLEIYKELDSLVQQIFFSLLIRESFIEGINEDSS